MTATVLKTGNRKEYGNTVVEFYTLKCQKCGYEFERDSYTTESRDVGCPCCTNKAVVAGINDVSTTDPWMVKFFQGGVKEAELYTSGSVKKIYPVCPDCGRVRDKPMAICELKRYHGFQCVCSDGKTFPNKFIYGVAEELLRLGQIERFKSEYGLDNKAYDMCFMDEGILVEMDSGVNHGHVNLKHKKKPIPSAEFRNDLHKDQIAEDNNFNLIRIDCYKSEFDFIKQNVMESELAKIFDLSVIEWNNVLELCTTNLVKKVCEYKAQHQNDRVVEIAEKFGLSDVTTRKYLRMGSELGWCVFDPQSDYEHYLSEHVTYNARPVFVDTDDDPDDEWYISKTYKSLSEMDRNSKDDFGVHICRETILRDGFYETGYNNRYDGINIYLI